MKTIINIFGRVFLAMFLLSVGASVQAYPITIQINGSVTNWDGSLGSEFVSGEAFYAEYTYDSAVADTDSFADNGRYALDNFWGTLGDYAFGFNGGSYDMLNDTGLFGDQIFARSLASGNNIGDASIVSTLLWFRDIDGNFLSDDSLLTIAPDLSVMEQTGFGLAFDSETEGRILVRANIDSAHLVSSVPEPATLLLMSIGLAGLVISHKKGRNK